MLGIQPQSLEEQPVLPSAEPSSSPTTFFNAEVFILKLLLDVFLFWFVLFCLWQTPFTSEYVPGLMSSFLYKHTTCTHK